MRHETRVRTVRRPDDGEVEAVTALTRAAAAADGVEPLSEAFRLALRRPAAAGAGVRHLIAHDRTGRLRGYAQVDTGVRPATGELVVHPDARRRGVGRTLLEALADRADPPWRVWAHGDGEGARALAAAVGWARARELRQMRRPLPGDPLPPARLPPGVRLRAFVPGRDEDAWLAVNAAAFAGHPEQGRWTRADLDARAQEPWFDAEDLLLAVEAPDGEEARGGDTGTAARGERLVGFHWTKVPGDGTGEVYVLGVAPDAQGRKLGSALTVAGLEHLARRGLEAVTLYVDAGNTPAVRLYERLGFGVVARDVQYASG
jgi:mycothiol synthase